ncbi:hypothetical protein LSH36_325g03036 [Paralvinella palmiformis]|uniref:Tetratricopeptide repeat protein 14 n=1 Tax=Paralvinella palmiformis TaxID=53620 RepID=A0AAD9JHL3_9ANNE|nr:hypothetical protein LSH36_325g03036 [Paralvinella palmiformis]
MILVKGAVCLHPKKAFCPLREIPKSYAHEDPLEHYDMKDKVRGTVLSVSPQKELIVTSFQQRALPQHLQHIKLGLISDEDLPEYFRLLQEADSWHYNEYLERLVGFANPSNVATLSRKLGLTDHRMSLTRVLHNLSIDKEEEAETLHKRQSYRYALKSVAEGINHFKQGKQVEAMQYLNKALQIDKENVEALVARGALFANNESYLKAIEDFEEALRLNPDHVNAKKYMCETLVANGRRLVEQDMSDDAIDYLQKALILDGNLLEAEVLLKLAQERVSNNLTPDSSHVTVCGDNNHKTNSHVSQLMETKELLRKIIEEEKGESRKVKNMGGVKDRQRSSSSESSSSSSSSSSSGSSSSSSSDSSSSSGSSSGRSSSDGSGSHGLIESSKHESSTVCEKTKDSQHQGQSSERRSDRHKRRRHSSEESDRKGCHKRSDSVESTKDVANGRRSSKDHSESKYEEATDKRRRSDDLYKDVSDRSRRSVDKYDETTRSRRTTDKHKGSSSRKYKEYEDRDDRSRRSHRQYEDDRDDRRSHKQYEDDRDDRSRRSHKQYEDDRDDRSRRSHKGYEDDVDDRSRRSHKGYEDDRDDRSRRSHKQYEHRSKRSGRSDRKHRDSRSDRSDDEYKYSSSRSRREYKDERRISGGSDKDHRHTSNRSYRSGKNYDRDRSEEIEVKRTRLGSDNENYYDRDREARKRRSYERSRSPENSSSLTKHGDQHQIRSEREKQFPQSSEDNMEIKGSEYERMKHVDESIRRHHGNDTLEDEIIDLTEQHKDQIKELTQSKWGDNWIAIGSKNIPLESDAEMLPTTSADQQGNLPDVVQDVKTGSDVEDDEPDEGGGHQHGSKRKHHHPHQDKAKMKDRQTKYSSEEEGADERKKSRKYQGERSKQNCGPSLLYGKKYERDEGIPDRKKPELSQIAKKPEERDSLTEMEDFLAMLKEKKKQQASVQKS